MRTWSLQVSKHSVSPYPPVTHLARFAWVDSVAETAILCRCLFVPAEEGRTSRPPMHRNGFALGLFEGDETFHGGKLVHGWHMPTVANKDWISSAVRRGRFGFPDATARRGLHAKLARMRRL
ncbi:hypothetical protein VFPPC_15990 [Pochonia chlamydosporia 170]|uniref:Uncharacterized protein n=1 Tax=Pochonia chlamydosporia 170 TaxID=1380566 RepID=A0A179FLQ8_METCM|nr:hypothetical protein VFPPC_15990 [Pochonia chlamydosporia 170]OAQ66160.2 hypothetical protein VFPPC_15990 [Pochonia chlamydosporia 170]